MSKHARYDEAVEAVRVFRSMQYGLTSFARGLTGRSDVSVQVSQKTNGATDGKTIFFRPPLILGRNNTHTRALCDRRDENLQLLCDACQAREVVMSIIYHEIAHIAFDSFEPVSEISKVEMVKRLVKEHGTKKGGAMAARLEDAPPMAKASYQALAQWINQFFPLIVNGLEDARVNTKMVQARSGIRVMLEAQLYRVFNEGIEIHGGEVQHWKDRPLNLQMIIGIYLQAVDLPFEGWLDPKVVADLKTPTLVELTDKIKDLPSAREVFELSFDILVAIRELGYCKQEYDETEEEEEDDPAQSPEEQDQADEPEEAGGDEADESEGDAGGGSPGDAEAGDSGSDSVDSESSGEGEPEGEGEGGGEGEGQDGVPSGAGDLEGDGSSGVEEGSEEVPEDAPGGDAPPEDLEITRGGAGGVDEVGPSSGEDRSNGSEDAGDGSGAQPMDPEPDAQGEGDASQEVDPDGARGEGSGDPGPADPGADPEGEGVEDEGQSSTGNGSGDGQDGEESEPGGQGANAGSRPGAGGDPGSDDGPSSPSGYTGDDPDSADGRGDDDSTDEGAGQVLSDLDFGTAEDVEDALDGVLGHDNPEMEDDRAEVNLVKKAVEQSEFFDTPSMNVYSTHVVRRDDKQHDYSPWSPLRRTRHERIKIDESLLSKALMHSRVIFSDNKRAKNVGNLKSGKVNGRVLGKRAFGNDERLFKKKTQPNKRDYFVVLGIDVSGSTDWGHGDERAIVLERRAVMAQAEILNRLGIPFSIFAHSGIFKGGKDEGREMQLEIYEVKGPRDPWTNKERANLETLQPSAFNLDGHTMEFYRKQLDASNATDKVLIYYTDGAMPCENFSEELTILQREIKTCRQRGYSILAVGVGNNDPLKYGLDTVRVDTDADIVNVVKHLERRLAVV